MSKRKLKDLRPTHLVEFFDSFTMKNQVKPCRIINITYSDGTLMAIVEVDEPIRKRIRLPMEFLKEFVVKPSKIREVQVDNFCRRYGPILLDIVKKETQHYVYPLEEVPLVVNRMRAAFLRGSYNHDGQAIKATCKQLGIKHTRKAMEEYFNGDPETEGDKNDE